MAEPTHDGAVRLSEHPALAGRAAVGIVGNAYRVYLWDKAVTMRLAEWEDAPVIWHAAGRPAAFEAADA